MTRHNNKPARSKLARGTWLSSIICGFLLASCGQVPQLLIPATPSLPPTLTATSAPTSTPTPSPTPTATLVPTPTPIALSKLGTVEKNVTYCTMNGVPVHMDVYYPPMSNGPWPAVIIVHGGAWSLGDKTTTPDLGAQPGLNVRGFLVVSINYRLAPAFPWPSMIEDAKCAVRSLRAHAFDYNLNPDRIGALGDSVGGQIVLLLGLTDQSVGWDVGEYLDYSSQVQAVTDFFGPTRLNDDSLYHLINGLGQRAFYNTLWNSPELIKASPITYAKADAPPIFIAHGTLDDTVPFVQSQMFYDQMKALGAPIWLVAMKNAIHSFAPVFYDVSPTEDEVMDMTVNFFTNELTPPPDARYALCGVTPDPVPMDGPAPACAEDH